MVDEIIDGGAPDSSDSGFDTDGGTPGTTMPGASMPYPFNLRWGDTGQRLYETGLDRGVFFPISGPGVAWSGLVSMAEKGGGSVTGYYIDGVKYMDVVAYEDFQATMEAYAAPRDFLECDGSRALAPGLFATQQPRKPFHMSYRTRIGSDISEDHGYKIHLVYNALAIPSDKTYKTQGETAELTTLQWNISTVPEIITGIKPTAHLVVNSTLADPAALAYLENVIYGTETIPAELPAPSEIVRILSGSYTDMITEPLSAFL